MTTKTCISCNEEKPLEDFHKNKLVNGGYQRHCKACVKIADAKRFQQNKAAKVEQIRNRQRNLLEQWRCWKGGQGCAVCSETEPVVLELHHLNPSEKEIHPSDMIMLGWGWERVMKEAKKCVVVCSNCHKKIHHGIIKLK